MPEHTEDEMDAVGTGETKAAEADAVKDWDMKPDAEGRLPLSPDLNQNGIAEEVRLVDLDDGQELQILENGELIHRETGYYAHAGQTSVFLCTLEGEDYLLRYHPTMYQGVGSYSYVLSAFGGNKEKVVRWSEIDFDINFGSLVHTGFDPESIDVFVDEINDLLFYSVQLLNTEEELQGTFEREGRLYDSLWWLDGWEPNFVRDENKSLRENLEEFQTGMTAAQEPLIPEEPDGLPITEPLELAFYSGAGAWSTYMVLEPDGSFAAYYHDTNGYTVYVCPYYGRFGKVEKLTDASWLLTLDSLERDTERCVGEEWDEEKNGHTIHYIASEPYGFTDADEKALKAGAQFILYSPEAVGHEPGTELYGAVRFQMWMHERREFIDSGDKLGCWGQQNLETREGFFTD
ncbi:MAG: hypothetical protein K2K90_02600 [Lachnospiraceae bacterium]|nr:hypothetical protein [Lachnospiraceae bacterium]